MRSRTLKEGSVGLMIIGSVVLFGALALWIRGFKFGAKSYQIVADFPDVNGIRLGDGVRYRGLRIGKIENIKSGTNGVDVVIAIDSSDLLIPRDSVIKARSSGLIGETFVDIVPQSDLSETDKNLTPLGDQCNPAQILCDNSRIEGERAITLDDILPFTYRFSKAYGEPEFVENVDATMQNSAQAAQEIANLSRNTSLLVKELQAEIDNVSAATKTVTDIANSTSTELVTTAQSFQETAKQVGQLTQSVESLIAQNRTNLTTTLDSISTTSDRLQNLVVKIDKTVDTADTEKLAANLETLTANAAVASENLKNVSESFGNQESVVNLQQTLDSARVTFDNAQKITSDLESITGDPAFLENFRTLVDGLSNLVSTTEQLDRQVQTTKAIQPMQEALSVSPKAEAN
ncbi:MCE family protein [Waterburya agarophytonicola K14]|uniref:MCE family protein n=1 Tax=Waterburya agarophytonicola KI4 TaxID=2874699 RepID=A0A964BSP5_9CYAN|nr:MlaD family protein [Waterburya agarophytonicola]MCC0177155.1 MCE family protein [Waterburya agarophytonicola KI4]